MTIRAVFRVQCDGPCKGWLSISPEYAGREILPDMMTVEPTAVHAANWPGERAARLGALGAGWTRDPNDSQEPRRWLCRSCRINPLGIQLPPLCADPQVSHAVNFSGRCLFCDKQVSDL
jgi:hypothetical protein